jgi:protoheme IX farnesyltransferase
MSSTVSLSEESLVPAAPVVPTADRAGGWRSRRALPRAAGASAGYAAWSHLADYLELTKPKISLLVLVCVAVSCCVAAWGVPPGWLMLHTLLGTALVAASANALNQWLEAARDARMQRTCRRPLPAGRLQGRQVLAFGIASIVSGTAYLALAAGPQAALLGFITWVLYVWVYTPLKAKTTLNTVVGAVAGAMPMLLGWAAVRPLDLTAAALFMIVYLWQFPHFMAIAWMYRQQYAAAGLQMLSVADPTGRRAGRQAVVAAAALLPVSLLPAVFGAAGAWFAACAVALGLAQLLCGLAFRWRLSEFTARLLLRASLVYLPVLLLLLLLEPLI